LLQQQQQQGPKSFSQNLSAKMNDEYLGIDGTRKHQKQNSDKTKQKNQRNHHKKLRKRTEKEQKQEQLQKPKQSK
jgi:hypothetical protein